MKRMIFGAVVLLCAAGKSVSASLDTNAMVMDGLFDDWRGVAFARVDAPDDGTGAFDVCRVSAVSRGTELFVRFNVGRVLTIQAGPEEEGTLIVEIETDAGRRVSIDLRGRSVWLDGDRAKGIGHAAIGLLTAPTHSSEQFEMRVDVSVLGVSSGDGVTIRFRGSDEIDAPVRVVLNDQAIERGHAEIGRTPGTGLRVASLNVYHNGLTKPDRRDAIARMIRAVDADVYCLQEEWRTPASEIAGVFDAATGAPAGAWRAETKNGAAVVSRVPIVFPETGLDRVAMGVVTTAGGERTGVMSLHLKCCGYDGSSEDRKRIEEVRSIESAIGSMGDLADGFVVTGDWNLVGSALPLAVLTAGDGAGFERVRPMQLDGAECYTWRNSEQSFSPGVLDLVVHSASLRVLRSFVLDMEDMSDAQLAAAGLERTDSGASDHLMIVTDFALAE